MAASSSAGAREFPLGERIRLVRPLGARTVPTWAALETMPDKRTRLVVIERVVRGGEFSDPDIADWSRDARRIATLDHPNLTRVREVITHKDEVLVLSDYVDGVRWSELGTVTPRLGLETSLRVLVDVLTGLSALHNLRDAQREPLKLVHGELGPESVIVGLDGFARIASPCRMKSASARPGAVSGYLAPEVLLADESADARADVFSVGVMLWEALTGRSLFANMQASAIVTSLLSGRLHPPSIPEGCEWAAPLVEATVRALSADPDKRFGTAASFAAEIRRVASARLVPSLRVGAAVRTGFGETIRLRRESLERGESRTQEVDIAVDLDGPPVSARPTPVPQFTATTRPPPPIEGASAAAAFPAPPAVPKVEVPSPPNPAPPVAKAEPSPVPPRVPPIRAKVATLIHPFDVPPAGKPAPPPAPPVPVAAKPDPAPVAPPAAAPREAPAVVRKMVVVARKVPAVGPRSGAITPEPAAVATETGAVAPEPRADAREAGVVASEPRAVAREAIAVAPEPPPLPRAAPIVQAPPPLRAPPNIPPPSRVPPDIVAHAALEDRAPPPVPRPPLSPMPAVPPIVTPLEPPPLRGPRSRRTVIGAAIGAAALLLVIVLWRALGSSGEITAATASQNPSATASARAPAATTSATATQTAATPPAPTATETEAPSIASAAPSATAPREQGGTAVAPTMASPVPPPAVAPARPAPVRRYEPQGI